LNGEPDDVKTIKKKAKLNDQIDKLELLLLKLAKDKDRLDKLYNESDEEKLYRQNLESKLKRESEEVQHKETAQNRWKRHYYDASNLETVLLHLVTRLNALDDDSNSAQVETIEALETRTSKYTGKQMN